MANADRQMSELGAVERMVRRAERDLDRAGASRGARRADRGLSVLAFPLPPLPTDGAHAAALSAYGCEPGSEGSPRPPARHAAGRRLARRRVDRARV